jgi:menaquinone-9 beta-reductase
MNPTNFDVLVLGGGPAGAASAIELARAGLKVAVIERSMHAHDKVCGEFLSSEAIDDLKELGVDPMALGAIPIHTVRLAGMSGVSAVRLPFAALSLTRRTLDEALLQHAAGAGACVLRGHSAESLLRQSDRWTVRITGPERNCNLEAAQVVLATGKHDLRGSPRPAGIQGDLVAFKMYLRLVDAQVAALRGCIELILFQEGYAGLQMEERGTANLCWVVRKRRLRDLGGRWELLMNAMQLENPHLRMRFRAAEPLLDRPLAVNPIPYGFIREEASDECLWAVGDQAAVIPSFTGDGIALALHSARLAARMLIADEPAGLYQQIFARRVKRQMQVATLLSHSLVKQPQRSLLEIAARLWPGGMRAIASSTRLTLERAT